jgi:hypothetical protein
VFPPQDHLPYGSVTTSSAIASPPTESSWQSSDYVVDVQPADGPLFRAKVSSPRILGDFRPPTPGAVVGVEYDPKSHEVRFDKDDPAFSMKALSKTLHSSLASSFDATLAQPAGSAQPSGGPSAETMAQLQVLLGPGKQLPQFPPTQDPPV